MRQSGGKLLTGNGLTRISAFNMHISSVPNFGSTMPECVIIAFPARYLIHQMRNVLSKLSGNHHDYIH